MPFDIGFIEICTIMVVALILLGPDKLPVAARALSRWYRGVTRTLGNFQSAVDRELQVDELKRKLQEQEKKAQTIKSSLNKPIQNIQSSDGK